MVSPLLGSLAKTIAKKMSPIFLDATLTRDVPGVATDPADPPLPRSVVYRCKAIEDSYGVLLQANGLVNSSDVKVLILAATLAVDPQPLDRITIRDVTRTIVPGSTSGVPAVTSDPARATWECRTSN